jgi:hypothetical protein
MGPGRAFDGGQAPAGANGLGQGKAEEACAGVEIGPTLSRLRLSRLHDGVRERGRGRAVNLPESLARHPEVVVIHDLGQVAAAAKGTQGPCPVRRGSSGLDQLSHPDAVRQLLRDAVHNLAHLPQATAVHGRVERVLASLEASHHAVVLDPPRAGAGAAVTGAIAASGMGKVIYVACDPSALAKDAARLLQAGYRLEALRAFDLYPNTHHLEAVAVFAKS